MFPLRRAALRLLSSSPSSARSFSVSRRCLITSTSAPFHRSPPSVLIGFQKRWMTSEKEVEEKDVPVSQPQPTPEEEVENAISEDKAATNVADTFASSSSGSTAEHVDSSPAAADDAVAADEAASTSAQDSDIIRDADDSIGQQRPDSMSAVDATEGVETDAVAGATTSSRDAPRERFDRYSKEPRQTLYIGNLFFDVTENDLIKELSRFGVIKRARLIRDARGLSKGFGYVEFENIEMAETAVAQLNNQLFEGRRLNVQFAAMDFQEPVPRNAPNGRPSNPPTKTLFIGNMSFEMTDRDLNNLFRGIRNVVDVRVAIDRRTGQPRGFAHADFVDVKSAMEALKVLQEKETYGRRLRVDYSFGPSTAPRNTPRDDSS